MNRKWMYRFAVSVIGLDIAVKNYRELCFNTRFINQPTLIIIHFLRVLSIYNVHDNKVLSDFKGDVSSPGLKL